ncbi:MAG: hypothetical protein ER33_10305 [Cyanobium sp. CACIAM 14]|nr:MAG: hypothetical protein ER33_10305 [Cyanobium sp. CACIAM 14]
MIADTVLSDAPARTLLRATTMTLYPPRTLEDDADDPVAPQRTLEDHAAELTGEPSSSIGDDSDENSDDDLLTEAELEAAAGVQSPPGRID